MTTDASGNNIQAVGVPITGYIGYAPLGTTLPTPVEGADPDFVLPEAFKKLGLITDDGGPQWAWKADGDPLTFWQEGYTIPSGLADVTVESTFAQTDDIVREFLYGKTPDANGFLTVDGGGNPTHYVIFTEEIFKSGLIRRRVAADGNILTVAEDQSTPGKPLGYDTTININASPLLGNDHFGEWLIPDGSGSNS